MIWFKLQTLTFRVMFNYIKLAPKSNVYYTSSLIYGVIVNEYIVCEISYCSKCAYMFCI